MPVVEEALVGIRLAMRKATDLHLGRIEFRVFQRPLLNQLAEDFGIDFI